MSRRDVNLFMLVRQMAALAALILFGTLAASPAAEPGWMTLSGHVPRELAQLQAKGRLSATNQLHLAIGLPLHDAAGLDRFLADVYDPASPNFRKFLTPEEFTARFGPAESDYAAVKEFARTNGLAITATPDSRLLLDVSGSAAAVEKAFHITLRTYRHPTEARDFFAPDTEPAVAVGLPVADISGLTDFYRPHPNSHLVTSPARAGAVAQSGSAPDGYSYFGNDFQNAYVPGTTLTGAGQMVGLLQFDGFYSNDIAAYATAAGGGRTNIVIQTVLLDGFSGVPTTGANSGNPEVSLDIEMAMSMAPGLSEIVVFEAPNNTAFFNDVLNAMASTNTYPLLNNLSCSWGGGGPKSSSETIFKKMAAQGQSFFNASGDSDAFTGSVPFPSESTNITQVGGTTLSMNGAGVSYASETAWNRNNGVGSSGGVSTTYGMPYWQRGISMAANYGSTTMRNIPDVALTAEYCYVMLGNGSSGSYGGTSCAAPLWAGFMALVNQQAAAAGQNPVGFINPAVYAIGNSSIYNSCFNDITTGNNYSSSSPTKFSAVAGYDLCTGWGTPNGTNLINAILWPPPLLLTQPVSRTVTNGVNVTFSVTASGLPPLNYQWLCNGTNLSDGGNLSGSVSNVLSITPAWTNNSGNYQLVASNQTGSVSSSVVALNVGFAPVVSMSPSSLTNLVGSNVVFAATVTGSTPLVYQWRKNGTNLANGTGISGVTTTNLTLTAVTTNSSGNYSLFTTNIFGVVTSSVANLLVAALPSIVSSSLTNRTIECGKNTNAFVLIAAGTAPLRIQWSTNGVPVIGATNTSFTLTNVHLPNYTVAVAVTNLYGSATSNTLLTVHDTLVPVITLNGSNPFYVELGSSFTDPGATANDTCAGAIAVVVSGTVNTNAVGTNTLTYIASDGNGNSATNTRTVVVRDTTPPVISWSFTNLVLAANSNCVAAMPSATGTNFILATDLSGALTITQRPTNNATLPLGTNIIVITVADASGNKSYSTNRIAVRDQTPPVIALNGFNPMTNELGAAFADPGVIASDTCSGVARLTTNGTVNVNAVGTNTLTYTAVDGSGNTNTATRTVIVCDTTPPTILWSFTNLVLAADTNCRAAMPDVTGTNYIRATDLSDPLAFSQSPTNSAVLLIGTNVVVVTVQDAFGNAASSTNQIIIQNQTPPVITLNGSNPVYVELGSAFSDPGATASDNCAGSVSVGVSGSVNANAVGINTLTYAATNGSGYASSATRSVIVRDTTPPTISWSFTNLILAADTDCRALMPDVTGTNYILANDFSGALTVTQNPTNQFILPLGTNTVVIAVADASGNTAFSTNSVIVQDQTPPVFLCQPQNQTNFVGTTATFSATATACTPLAWQWFFNTTALAAQTNDTLTLSNLTAAAAGNYCALATASGGSSNSAVATLTVNLYSPTVALVSSANPAGFKDNLIFTANVTPTIASGTIQFFTNGAAFDMETILAGTAVSTNLASLPRGTNEVTAVYSGDTFDLPFTNSVEQIVTNHPPSAVSAIFTNTASFALNIPITELAATWSDVDGDAVSLADVGVSTGGITLTNNGTALVYFNSNNVADQFICTITDGLGGTNFQTVTIAPSATTPLITSVVSTPGGVSLNLGGAPGSTYILETTTDLFSPGDWQPVATNTLDNSGVWQFNDSQTTNFTQRFYRLKLAQ